MQQYIGFHLNASEYMIPILKVREIITMPSITALPQLPSYIKGVTNLRGSVIPVINLKNLLGSFNNEEAGGTVIVLASGKVTFGVIVDGITGVVKVDESEIEPPERFINNAEHIEGVAKLDNRLIVLLNIKKLLPLDDMNLLEDAIVNVTNSADGNNVEIIREVDTIGGKITIKELRNAKEFMAGKLDTNDPRHNLFDLMLNFMDALAVHDYQKMETIVEQLVKATDSDLFKEIGRITRKLHDSLEEFKGAISSGVQKLTRDDVPNAVDNLQFVIKKTEEAANKTMGIVERYFEESNDFSKHIGSIKGSDEAVNYLKSFKESLDNDMTMILTAQQFQDITGQTIKKVMDLVNNVEVELLRLITKFGMLLKTESDKVEVGVAADNGREQETVEKSAEKVSQSDVEGLLNDFGF
ncbi:MAG: protein phosphatase CheZ [Nitrospirae bacterium]|nr:protein phosphatase CheZ [Nitrospirota bacterium]